MFELLISELLASLKEVEKNCHGSMAAYTRIGYGTPPDGSFANRPKTIVNTSIVRNGRITLQASPITVCLYLTKISRQARKKKSSRYCHRSVQYCPFDRAPSITKSNPAFSS